MNGTRNDQVTMIYSDDKDTVDYNDDVDDNDNADEITMKKMDVTRSDQIIMIMF